MMAASLGGRNFDLRCQFGAASWAPSDTATFLLQESLSTPPCPGSQEIKEVVGAVESAAPHLRPPEAADGLRLWTELLSEGFAETETVGNLKINARPVGVAGGR
jgi:hypothetical protein